MTATPAGVRTTPAGRAVLALVAVAAALLTGACGTERGSVGAPAASRTPITDQVDERDSGATVDLHVGDVLVVTLHSTYWQLAALGATTALRPQGAPETVRATTCARIPGSGCGSVTVRYTAVARGSVTLTAHRDSCGEALRCASGQGDWKVVARVTG